MGGRLGAVVKSYLATVPGTGATAQYIAVEEFAGDERKAQVFGPANEDSAPPATIKTLDFALGSGRGFLVSAAYYNQHITPIALPGERRLYSTDENGEAVKAEIHLKQDGEIYAANGNASSTIAADGTITAANANANLTLGADGDSSILTKQLGIWTLDSVFGILTNKLNIVAPEVETSGSVKVGTGGSGVFVALLGQVVTVANGITIDIT